jgi:hypothetical protein
VRAPGDGETPGALCCRSGFPPIPAETHQKYSKRSPLTVLFRLQVQKYFLARLWLILADPMVSAIQQFRGSNQRVDVPLCRCVHPNHWQVERRANG